MTNLLSFPFRVGPNGFAVTRPDDSSEYYGEELHVLMQTRPGERPQLPQYGMNDPTFNRVDPQELVLKVNMFGPPVRIVSLTTKVITDTTQDVLVTFEPVNEGQEYFNNSGNFSSL